MIKVKFLEAQEVEDGEGIVYQSFRAGQVIELNNAAARFWLSRGLALDVQAVAREEREEREAEKKAAPAAVADAKDPVVTEKKPEAEKVDAVEEKAKPSTGKTNPTSRGFGGAKRSSASHRGRA